jgi:hypothetical protein
MNRWVVYSSLLMLCACSEDKVAGPVPVLSEADAIKIGQSCSGPQFQSDAWTAQRDGKQWRVTASEKAGDPKAGEHLVLKVLIDADDGQIEDCSTLVN